MTTETGSYASIVTALFVRIDVPDYAVIRVSDYIYPVTIDGESYIPLGRLLALSAGNNELRAAPSELTVTLSGIPNTSIAVIKIRPGFRPLISTWHKAPVRR